METSFNVRKIKNKSEFEKFCENSSAHGLKYLTISTFSKWERLFWVVISLGTILGVVYLSKIIWDGWLDAPTFITLDPSNFPSSNIEYPGVAICDINKISRKRAEIFAGYLKTFLNDVSILTILKDLKHLGSLYTMNTHRLEDFGKFQSWLDKYDNKTETKNMSRRLLDLTTPCDELFLECWLHGSKQNCSKLFFPRLSDQGFCCVFNYIRPPSRSYYAKLNPSQIKSEHLKYPGTRNGLRVSLKNNISDYFLTTSPTFGYMVQIFSPFDYPDQISGSLTEFFLSNGNEITIKIEPEVVKSEKQVEYLAVNVRNCKLRRDENTVFGPYRHSDCMVSCKIKSILSLCGCLPFMLPIDPDPSQETNVCSLNDIFCLDHYKGKWSRYYPKDPEVDDLKNEESLKCENCLPSCNNIFYKTYVNTYPYHEPKNKSSITIYFTNNYANLYKNVLYVTWYEKLSSFGGILSIFMGTSLISAIEFLIIFLKVFMIYVKGQFITNTKK